MENLIKMDDLGGKPHYFRKHPYPFFSMHEGNGWGNASNPSPNKHCLASTKKLCRRNAASNNVKYSVSFKSCHNRKGFRARHDDPSSGEGAMNLLFSTFSHGICLPLSGEPFHLFSDQRLLDSQIHFGRFRQACTEAEQWNPTTTVPVLSNWWLVKLISQGRIFNISVK